jgi:hypothetical protein
MIILLFEDEEYKRIPSLFRVTLLPTAVQFDEFSKTMPPMFFATKLFETVQLVDSVNLIP